MRGKPANTAISNAIAIEPQHTRMHPAHGSFQDWVIGAGVLGALAVIFFFARRCLRPQIDLSDRLQEAELQEEALKRQRDFLEQILATSVSAITVVDQTGQIIFANDAAISVFGLSKRSVEQRAFDSPEWQIERIEGGPFPEDELPFNRVKATNKAVWDVRHAIRWPDGKRHILSINTVPMCRGTDEKLNVVCAITDREWRLRWTDRS